MKPSLVIALLFLIAILAFVLGFTARAVWL